MKTKTPAVYLLSATLALAPALAGVVYEIEVKDHEQSPPKTESIEAAVEGRHLKMGIASGGRGAQGEMIFRGDRREMVVVDHDNRTYHLIDEAAVGQIAAQVGGAMRQMQEALKNVPADKRAMIEQMMKQKMPDQAPARPENVLQKTGDRADMNGYPCVKYEVLRGGRKIRELWVTDWSNVEGGGDVVDAFEDMAEFFGELMDAIPDFGQDGPHADPAFEH
ncbi:MAG: hypothetical protein ACE5EG_09800, partial [Thermoanaerobaculia bacterium]